MPWVLFIVQLIVTAVVIGILSVVLVVQVSLVPGAVFAEYDGLPVFVASLAVDGIIGIVEALVVFVATGLVVGIIGLPVRLIPALRRFWLGNGEITIAGVFVGIILLVISYVPLGAWQEVRLQASTYQVFAPSPWPLQIGWLLLALSLSLRVWPSRWLPPRARAWWTETQLMPRRKGAAPTALPL